MPLLKTGVRQALFTNIKFYPLPVTFFIYIKLGRIWNNASKKTDSISLCGI